MSMAPHASSRVAFLCAGLLAGCAGSPRTSASRPATGGTDRGAAPVSFALPEGFAWLREGPWRAALPSDWRPLRGPDGRRVGWGNGGGLSANAVLEPLAGPLRGYVDAGLATLTRGGFTTRDRRPAEGGEQWVLEDPGREASVRARAWVGVTFGRGLAVVCSGPEPRFAQTEQECEQVFASLRWNSREPLVVQQGRQLVQGEGWSLTVAQGWTSRPQAQGALTYASDADEALSINLQNAPGDPRAALRSAAEGLARLAGHTLVGRQPRVLGGVPGELVDLRRPSRSAPMTMLQRALGLRDRVLVLTCGGPTAQLERFRATCQSALDSLAPGAAP